MNYEQFQKELQQKIAGKLDPTVKVTISQQAGNNGTLHSGLAITDAKNHTRSFIALDGLYQAFLDGEELSGIVDEIIHLPDQFLPPAGLVPELLNDFDQVKNRIVFKLVNLEKNASQLANKVYVPFLDLAVMFHIILKVGSGIGNIPVQNAYLKLWNVDVKTLWDCAVSNGPTIFPAILEPIETFLMKTEIQEIPEEPQDKVSPVLILSNQERYWGAVSLLYEGVLQKIGDLLQMNYFVVPSSVHETLIYPECIDQTKEELDATIRFVNNSEMDPQDILSDHAYYYDREQGRLLIP